jgi:cell division protein FtsW
LLIHFIFNVGGVTALLPLTGVPLLLISSGGSSTLSVMMALGIAQRMIIDQKAQEDA